MSDFRIGSPTEAQLYDEWWSIYFGVWKRYAVFRGRAPRREFWVFFLLHVGIFVGLLCLINISARLIILAGLYFGATIVPLIALQVRRLHDTGREGWWWFITSVPIIGVIVLLVFMAQDGQATENQYGPSPKARATADVGARAAPGGASRRSETAITLWAANEQTARQLLDDQYFLLGVLVSDQSDTATRFRDALGQEGGSISGRFVPNPTRGGYDVHLKVLRSAPASANLGTCPYCGATLSKAGSAVRVRLDITESGTQGFFCPECGHQFEPADMTRLKAAASAAAPLPSAVAGDYTGPPIADLTQSDVVDELVKAGIDRKRAEADVQVSIVLASTMDPTQIQAIHSSDQPLMVKDLALRWAVHCVAHGSKPRMG